MLRQSHSPIYIYSSGANSAVVGVPLATNILRHRLETLTRFSIRLLEHRYSIHWFKPAYGLRLTDKQGLRGKIFSNSSNQHEIEMEHEHSNFIVALEQKEEEGVEDWALIL